LWLFRCWQGSIARAIAAALSLAVTQPAAAAEPSRRLESRPDVTARVRVVLEAEGKLLSHDSSQRIQSVPMTARGEMIYDERRGPAQPGLLAMRHYQLAEATIEVRGRREECRLREARSLIACRERAGAVLVDFDSPQGPLTRDELELIDLPGNSAVIHALLPREMVAPGDSWRHDDLTLARLLNLDRVTESDVSSTWRSLEDGIARLELSGTVRGSVKGAATVIQLRGKYQFELESGCIIWLAMSFRENRSIGDLAPGLEVAARLRMVVDPRVEAPLLGDAELAGDASSAHLLEYSSPTQGYQLLLDRRWHLIRDDGQTAVLRFYDAETRLAQCNLSRLPDLPAGKHLELTRFQDDIRRALGEKLGAFQQVTQTTSPDGLRSLRVVASGAVSDVAIQWVYYHLSDDLGRRASFVCALEEKHLEKLAGVDAAIAASFRFMADGPSVSNRSPEGPAARPDRSDNRSAVRPRDHGAAASAGR